MVLHGVHPGGLAEADAVEGCLDFILSEGDGMLLLEFPCNPDCYIGCVLRAVDILYSPEESSFKWNVLSILNESFHYGGILVELADQLGHLVEDSGIV